MGAPINAEASILTFSDGTAVKASQSKAVGAQRCRRDRPGSSPHAESPRITRRGCQLTLADTGGTLQEAVVSTQQARALPMTRQQIEEKFFRTCAAQAGLYGPMLSARLLGTRGALGHEQRNLR